MTRECILTLSVPSNAVLNAAFEDELGPKMAGALGFGWRLMDWSDEDLEGPEGQKRQEYRFVYEAERRRRDEIIADLSARATTSISLALPEINVTLKSNPRR